MQDIYQGPNQPVKFLTALNSKDKVPIPFERADDHPHTLGKLCTDDEDPHITLLTSAITLLCRNAQQEPRRCDIHGLALKCSILLNTN